MPQFVYKRNAVPVAESVDLDVQFVDSAGNSKDTDNYPTVAVRDAAGSIVRAASSSGVQRIGTGRYRLAYVIPGGFQQGLWGDTWAGAVDGYSISAGFGFNVTSIGAITAVDTSVEPLLVLGDAPDIIYTQAEIKGINILLQGLETRLRNQSIAPDGTPCPVIPQAELINYLRLGLSEFNAMPTITFYTFDQMLVYGLFEDVIVEGAFLQALSAVAILSAGQEMVITDNGTSVQPPPVSSTINTVISSRQALYLEKLKGVKRNLRPAPAAFGAGRILVNNPQVLKMKHRSEGRII